MARVLVTGAGGYVRTMLVPRLLEQAFQFQADKLIDLGETAVIMMQEAAR